MAPRKTKRSFQPHHLLTGIGRYLPKSRIREAVEGYHNLSDAAFERTFERDKDELRSLGVPIQVGSLTHSSSHQPGYQSLLGVRIAVHRAGR